jgi:hypothetical protein
MSTRRAAVLAKISIMLSKLSSRIQPYGLSILLVVFGFVFLVSLYMGRIPVITTPPPEQPPIASSIVVRIFRLLWILLGVAVTLTIVKVRWDCQTQPKSMRNNFNISFGFVKCSAIFAGAMSMSQGIESLISSARVQSGASALDFGWMAAALLALYGPTKMMSDRIPSFEELHDIVKHFILGLLFLVIMVDVFVPVPADFPPFFQMVPVAVAATILDRALSLIPENLNRISSWMEKQGWVTHD